MCVYEGTIAYERKPFGVLPLRRHSRKLGSADNSLRGSQDRTLWSEVLFFFAILHGKLRLGTRFRMSQGPLYSVLDNINM